MDNSTITLGPWGEVGGTWERRWSTGRIAANATRGDWWATDAFGGADNFGEAEGFEGPSGSKTLADEWLCENAVVGVNIAMASPR